MTRDGAWEAWLKYFLQGVAEQAEDAIARIRRIDELFHLWSDQFAGADRQIWRRFWNCLLNSRSGTSPCLRIEVGVAYTTARRAVDRLQSAGIVKPVGTAKRNRVYCADAVLEVLDAP